MKNVMLTTAALALYVAGFAQIEDQFSIGPRIGLNIANVANVTDNQTLIGFAAGVTSTYSFTETSGVTVDLLYSVEGVAHEFSDSEVKLGYVVIPIYYDYFFGELGSALRPKVYAGIAPAFLASAKQDGDDIKDEFGGFNFSFSAGGGVNYRLSDRVWLNGDLRAYIGLTDIREKEIQEGDTVATRNIQISVGVAFGL